jgi:hypothetical protein
LWRPPAVWISPTENNNQQRQILWNLEKLHKAIKWKRPGWLAAGVRLLHNGARPHTSSIPLFCLSPNMSQYCDISTCY